MKSRHRHPASEGEGHPAGRGYFLAPLLFAIAFLFAATPAHAIDASIVIDADTNTVISQDNPDRLLHPASLTKLMTLYMAFEALETGRISLQSSLPVSALAQSQEPTKLDLVAGQRIRVEDAILGLVTLSANDAAVVMAEGLGGSEDRFAQLMTRKAHQLGMVNTNFRNANGLPDPGQISSARDMAILARALIRQFPQYYHYFAVREFTYNGIPHPNHNHLMSRYEGMDGLKTGFIRASGFNLVASAVRNGRRLIAVVFGGVSAVQRDDFLATLLDEGFQRTGGVAMASAAPPPMPRHKPAELGGAVVAAAATPVHAITAGKPVDITGLVAASGGEGDVEGPDDAISPRAAPPTQFAGLPPAPKPLPTYASAPAPVVHASWGIQVGAYATRAATEHAIQEAVRRAPELLRNATAVVLALPRHKGSLYRARLTGLDAADARKACRLLGHCVTVPPGTS